MNATTTTRQHYLTADQLQPGDVVLHVATKARWFAAFDVDHSQGGTVRTWTAMSDQANGEPRTRDFSPATALLIERKIDGPAVTRTTLVMHDDGSVQVTRS